MKLPAAASADDPLMTGEFIVNDHFHKTIKPINWLMKERQRWH